MNEELQRGITPLEPPVPAGETLIESESIPLRDVGSKISTSPGGRGVAVPFSARRTSCRVHGSPSPGDLGGEGGRPRSPVVTSEVKEGDWRLVVVTSEVKEGDWRLVVVTSEVKKEVVLHFEQECCTLKTA